MSAAPALLLITTSYPRAVAGSEAAGSFVADLVEELARHMPVRVVAPGDAAAIERPLPNVDVYRFAAPDGALGNLRLWHPGDVLRLAAVLRNGAAAATAASADGAVVHAVALWALPSGYWARQLRNAGRIRTYSVWMLGSDVWSLGRIPIVRGLLARVIRAADRRYADGLQLAEDAARIAGLPVHFLPTTRRFGAPHPAPPAASAPYKLLFLGRWHPNKGVDLLLDALECLDDADWARIAELRVFGGGPLEPRVQAGVDALAAAGRPISRGGYLGKAEAEAAFARADYLVLPSRIESIPVIFSDAMKAGRPVIATPVGDLPRLVGAASPCGVLAAAASAPALAAALRQALAASAQAFAPALAAAARAFDLGAIAHELIEPESAHD